MLGLNYLNFDVRSLASGLYFIVLETGVGRQMAMRFVKE
jgi:hypothetical protein